MGQQVQHVGRLRHIAEIRRQNRIQRLRDQPSHVAEPLHDAGRLLVVDVQDQRQRQHRFIAVGRDQRDADQVLVVLMRFSLAGNPAQNEVHRRHELDLHGIRIDRILARRQGLLPHTALARLDLLAIAEPFARDVFAFAAVVRNDDADVTDRDERLRTHFNRGKPAIDEERAVGQHLQLLSAPSAERQEDFRILKVVVIAVSRAHFGRDDLARFERAPS